MQAMKGVSLRQFAKELRGQVQEDNVPNGAAALAFYWMLAIFPAMIFLLSILPFLPIPNLQTAIMDLLRQALPDQASGALTGTVEQIATQRRGGLLSFGFIATIWAASSGMYAIMQQLNITYRVKEARPFLKARGTALLLTLLFGALVIGAFAFVVLGGYIQGALGAALGWSGPLMVAFAALRWLIILAGLLLAFALAYYFAPNVEQKFKWISPGSVAGVATLVLASLAFRIYVTNFGNYDATYGSIGAVIVLMLWLYVVGLALLLGSEVNVVYEKHRPEGKVRGERRPGEHAAGGAHARSPA